MTEETMLIVGAGPVGLAMANALKKHGIAYHQVDAQDQLGGNWHGGVYQGVHLNSSKTSTQFADYPMPADYPDFPSAAQMKTYLNNYARDRGLVDAIQFSTSVVRADPQPDDSWRVELSTGETRTYKGVIVCNGHHWDRRWPDLPGEFEGEMFHSKDYVSLDQLRGKRVLTIGAGNSACDIVCDAARVAECSDVSMRGGYWFLPRVAFGRPINDIPIWFLPVTVQRWILRGIVYTVLGDYRKYGLEKPKHRIFDRHTTFGAEMLHYITLGEVRPRRKITAINGRTVRFSDGEEAEYDTIVAATGFNFSFPFLPDGLIKVENDSVQIYGYCFPANVKNLYLVGNTQPRGGFGYLLTPAADLYARLMKLQDELEHPIGAIMEFIGEKIPPSHLVDPGGARREIALSSKLLWYVKWQGERLAKKKKWQGVEPIGEAGTAGNSAPVAAE